MRSDNNRTYGVTRRIAKEYFRVEENGKERSRLEYFPQIMKDVGRVIFILYRSERVSVK